VTEIAPLVQATRAAGLATLTLDSPNNRNALSSALIEQLLDALNTAVADDAVRVIVITHTGPVFCSGADLKESGAAFRAHMQDHAGTAADAGNAGSAGSPIALPASRMGEVLATVWESPKPVVARVGGPARAGGLGLIAAADIAVCAERATFAFSEVRIGVVPAVISATVVPRLTQRAATELFLTGEAFDGARAERIGLVTAAVPAAELDAVVTRYTTSLLRGAPGALATAKSLARRVSGPSFADDLAVLTKMSAGFFASAEGREGLRAFAEKRDPSWVMPG
jgi:methylglutaconyl-CoA hydratase